MEADAQRAAYWAKHAELKRRYLPTLCRALEARSAPAFHATALATKGAKVAATCLKTNEALRRMVALLEETEAEQGGNHGSYKALLRVEETLIDAVGAHRAKRAKATEQAKRPRHGATVGVKRERPDEGLSEERQPAPSGAAAAPV